MRERNTNLARKTFSHICIVNRRCFAYNIWLDNNQLNLDQSLLNTSNRFGNHLSVILCFTCFCFFKKVFRLSWESSNSINITNHSLRVQSKTLLDESFTIRGKRLSDSDKNSAFFTIAWIVLLLLLTILIFYISTQKIQILVL